MEIDGLWKFSFTGGWKNKYPVIFLLFSLFTLDSLFGEDVHFAFVQYRVEKNTYRSEESFARDVEALVSEAVNKGSEVVVFPEYTGVFLATIPLSEELEGLGSIGEGISLLRTHYGAEVNLKDFFILRSREVQRLMDTVWGGIAEKYGIWIVAGTAFVAGPEKSLYNRLFIYAPDGDVCYTQDKVYQTPFEKGVVGLDGGRVDDAQTVVLEGIECGFTICRDTFFEVWNKEFSELDLWVDLKANGDEFDAGARETFKEALPERIQETHVEMGATVCLTGGFLELFWEGKSSVIRSAPNKRGYTSVVEARRDDGEQILYTVVSDSGP